MFWAIYLGVLFAGWAMMVREGLWSNAITLVNILISGIAAFGFYAPLCVRIDEEYTKGQHTYWIDFAIIWAIFAVVMLICRTITGAFSKTRMRFKHPIDPVGGPLVAFIAAWVLAAFATATLHVSPMDKNAFGGALNYTNADTAFFATQPDAAWLRFMETVTSPEAFGSNAANQIKAKPFVKIYGDRRERFEKTPDFIVKRG
ncbi:MAG: CvpA family protein [Pirellulales bacterium]